MTLRNTGKPSEKIFEDAFKAKQAMVYRFEDYADVNFKKSLRGVKVRAGGNPQKDRLAVQEKPSDFLVTFSKITFYAEIKSVKNRTNFAFSTLQASQWKAATKTTINGGMYLVCIHLMEIDEWYMVPFRKILEQDKKKRSMNHQELKPYRVKNDFT